MASKFNIGIILAAGNSTRFSSSSDYEHTQLLQPKQLHILNGKPIINYSINAFLGMGDQDIKMIIIVTNSKCYEKMLKIKTDYYNDADNIIFVVNDINCRIESMNSALKYIKSNKLTPSNVIVHDSARPFIRKEHLKILLTLTSAKSFMYAQYFMKLVNGLLNIETQNFVNRDNFVEICTPVCMNYNFFNYFQTYYINSKDDSGNRIYYEFIPIMKKLNIQYKLVEGHYNFLRKITTPEDMI
jgi:2-C-methyl-D-erythritol 4-phosphate cytidylyltransferase